MTRMTACTSYTADFVPKDIAQRDGEDGARFGAKCV